MQNTPVTVDLILPFYHPHDGWAEQVVEQTLFLKEFFLQQGALLHLYLVNDGSPLSCYPEDALEKIRAAADGNFTFLSYEKNHGKGYSLRYGIARAEGSYQFYTDGDFPFGSDCVVHAWELLSAGQCDIVMGVRSATYAQALCGIRRRVSGMVRKMNQFFLGLPGDCCDTQGGFKAFNAAGRKAFLATRVETFVFDTEFILIAYRRKLRIKPIPLHIRPGLHFSRMGFKILLRELICFLGILFRIRILRQDGEKE